MNTIKQFTEELSQKVITAVTMGCNPWKRSWEGGMLWPYNGSNGRKYTGMNAINLSLSKYEDPRFYSYSQAFTLGNFDKTKCEFVIMSWKRIKIDENGKQITNKYGEPVKAWAKKVVAVYNHRVIEFFDKEMGKPLPKAEGRKAGEEKEIVAKWAGRAGITLAEGEPSYNTLTKEVSLPKAEKFKTQEHYVKTAAHEFVHWTGQESVTKRHKVQAEAEKKKSREYAIEELVAEIGASILANKLGAWNTETEEQSVSYLRNWLKHLQDDEMLLTAASAWATTAVQILEKSLDGSEEVKPEIGEEAEAA